MIPTLPFNAELLVFAIAIVYTFTSVALQRRLADPKKLREMQDRMKSLSSELNSMIRSNAAQDAIKAKQQELMPLMSTSMMAQFKPMLVILPIFLVLYYWILPQTMFGPAAQVQFFILRGSAAQVIFFMVVFVLGLVSSFVVLSYDKKKAKEEREARAHASSPAQNTV
jgi:uncharacterized membrane protein (DUF106 family)